MAKCLNCLSCLKYITVFEHKYLYCTLCRKVYTIYMDKLKEVEDTNIIMEARRISGNEI